MCSLPGLFCVRLRFSSLLSADVQLLISLCIILVSVRISDASLPFFHSSTCIASPAMTIYCSSVSTDTSVILNASCTSLSSSMIFSRWIVLSDMFVTWISGPDRTLCASRGVLLAHVLRTDSTSASLAFEMGRIVHRAWRSSAVEARNPSGVTDCIESHASY